MMSIQDFLTTIIEGRDAPLYHWVDKKKLFAIFRENRMAANWEHVIPSQADRYVYGNSMSRNPQFVWAGGEIRLTFDQRRLTMNHKIIPLDGERTFYHDKQGMYDGDFTSDRDKPQLGMDEEAVMAEEFVLGHIEPLNKYITEIWYDGSDAQIKGVIRVYASKYGIKTI